MTTNAAAPAATTAAGTTTNTGSVLSQLEAKLSADAAAAIAWLKSAYLNIGTVLGKVAAGGEVLVEDIEQLAEGVASHVGLANAVLSSAGSVVSLLPASDQAAAQKALSSVTAATNDVAALGTSIQSGSTAGDPAAVQTAVTALAAAQNVLQLAAQTSAMITNAAGAAPAAAQAVSAATPNEG